MKRFKIPLLHAAGWMFFILNVILSYPPGFVDQTGLLKVIAKTATFYGIMALGFYVNYSILTPRLLAARRHAAWLALVLVCVACMIGLFLLHARLFDIWLGTGTALFDERLSVLPYLAFEGLFFIALSTGIRFSTDWFRMQGLSEDLRREREQAELALLRQQLSPHFLFNTMNNIYSLNTDDPARGSQAMLLLSDLMRRLLSSLERDSVPVEAEVSQLHSYIELKRLQYPDEERIRFIADCDTPDARVHPMLLLPFVENAFKHGDLHSPGTAVVIRLSVSGGTLALDVENTPSTGSRESTSGIGLHNVRRRLSLLYHGAHTLEIDAGPDRYAVALRVRIA